MGESTSARGRVIQSWSKQGVQSPPRMVGGKGCRFFDAAGRSYLDFGSQLVNANLGHSRTEIQEAVQQQVATMATIGRPWDVEIVEELANRLAEVTPGDLNSFFFACSGTEANEAAIRLARAYTGRNKVIARYRSYHGSTTGALTLTGEPRRWVGEPGMPGVVRMLDPYTYRCPAGHPTPCPVCSGAPHLRELLRYEGAENVAAVIIEPVTGINGVIVPPDGYLQAIREVCTEHGILLILDEVMTGFGRTGAWFACDRWGVVPDIITCAKGLTAGYLPLAAVAVSDRLSPWLQDSMFPYGLTHSAHPVACAAAVAALGVYRKERLVERSNQLGALIGAGLRELAERHPSIGDIRGSGCFWGIELVTDRESKEPLVPFNPDAAAAEPMRRVTAEAFGKGLYLLTHWNIVLVCPPLIIDEAELQEGLALLDETLSIADEYVLGKG
ncbi:aminotransferase class III-fold pyridoxal phosphate-dependent enzyme [Nocardia transvalensis]|uniref:aminotransferase class III-fold pyridoxal phosphate-dependent enzyme n=1 Tax=Nocardia transvalensis TaxID=37333 RepID=UPI001894179C|nr:aminotransferase class III-fold pyridoxal phosphate-dependent enzyme [Nocardia transvalensis]MBF6327713.1 aminotransferase class III-fold pyridoxal phosphate-dependent enzyme [Nocardia transvalensis]